MLCATVSRHTSPMGGCRSTPPWLTPPVPVFRNFFWEFGAERTAAKVRRRQLPDEPTKTQVLLSAGVPPALTQQNWVVLLCSGCAEPARPCGSGFLRSGRGLSCAPGPRSAARPRPAPPFGAPSPLGRLGAVVGAPPSPLPPPPAGAGVWRLRR